jgi:ethanolamine utilization microcompartment shell protein EutS
VINLRTFTYIDILQPQLTGFLQTVVPGFNPLERQAALFVEIAPGLAINTVTDIALKQTSVLPGLQIVERAFGVLEVHSFDQGQVRAAGEAILKHLGLTENDRFKPEVRTSERITGIDGHQAMLINRMRHGDMITEGQTLYVMECEPAGYACIAANEAEKAADVNLLEVRTFGAYGRLYLGGYEAEIEAAEQAIKSALADIGGRALPVRKR